MDAFPWELWTARLALESTLILAIVALLARVAHTGLLKRALWQGGFSAILLLGILSLTGRPHLPGNPAPPPVANGPQDATAGRNPATVPATGGGFSELPLAGEGWVRLEEDPTGAQSPAAPSPTIASTVVGEAAPPVRSFRWIPWVLLAGMAAWLVRTLVSRKLLGQLARRAEETTEADAEVVARWAKSLGLRRTVTIRESDAIHSPMVFGIHRPHLFVPRGFFTDMSIGQRDAVLIHELAHLRHRDPAWLFFCEVVTALFWWHPLVWLGRRQFQSACELAADEV